MVTDISKVSGRGPGIKRRGGGRAAASWILHSRIKMLTQRPGIGLWTSGSGMGSGAAVCAGTGSRRDGPAGDRFGPLGCVADGFAWAVFRSAPARRYSLDRYSGPPMAARSVPMASHSRPIPGLRRSHWQPVRSQVKPIRTGPFAGICAGILAFSGENPGDSARFCCPNASGACPGRNRR